MRSQEEVQREHDAILAQIRKLSPEDHKTVADRMLQERIKALMWVLEDDRVKQLTLDDKVFELFKCLR